MLVSVLIAVLSVAMLAYWVRYTYRLLSRDFEPVAVVQYERIYERAPIRSGGTLSWTSPEGSSVHLAVQGVNLSNGGALVAAKAPMRPGSTVLIHFEALKVITTATVRHCTAQGSRFHIGLEFRHPLMAADAGTWHFVVQPAAAAAGR